MCIFTFIDCKYVDGAIFIFVKGNMSVWFSHERFWRIEYLTILLLGAVIIYFGSFF